jgi:predicted Zn-dependent peptidase
VTAEAAAAAAAAIAARAARTDDGAGGGNPARSPSADVAGTERRYHRSVQEYVLSELDSGERLITEKVTSVRSVSLGFWIGAGSRDEPMAKAGVTHFIEHLLFKGTHGYSAQEIAEIFDEMGGELNAATSREHTVVYARVPDRHLKRALDVMADMVFSPAFAEVDSERDVVLEEIAMVEDTPQDLVHDLLAEAVFGGDPLGRPVIGRADVISSVTRRALSAYHRHMYTAGNIVLAAAGNLDHDPLLELFDTSARQRMEPPAQKTRVRRPLVKEPSPGVRFQRKDTEQYHACVGTLGISRSDRRRFAASVLDAILGGSASSRLFQEIREKRGMAYSVYSFASQYTDTGQIGLYVGTREENLDACLEIAADQITDIASGNVRAAEFQRAKENLKGRLVLSMESTSNRMSRLGKSLITDTELLSLDRIIAEIDAVEATDVAELASVLLAPERLSAAGIGPNEERFRAAVERVHPGLAAAA